MLVTDRENRHRGEHWGTLLDDIRTRGTLNPVLTRWPLGDKLAGPLAPGNPEFFDHLARSQVLIVNWDAINGDPEFGADVARNWFATRWLALRDWLNHGGMMILEGQTLLGVPDLAAYSAVLGPGEVRVSGPADLRRPESQTKHMIGNARMTPIGRRAPGFEGLDHIDASRDLTYNDLFPPHTAGRLIAPYVRQVNWAAVLYRGWFQRRRGPRSTLEWVPYARRHKWWPQNHPTLLVAKCNGRGVIYATTMLLSATRQIVLVEAMLQSCDRVADLPDLSTVRKTLARHAPRVVTAFLVGVIGLALTQEWKDTNLGFLGGLGAVGSVVWSVAVGLAVALLVELAPHAWRLGRRVVRAFTGA